jgi:flavorubredoxin
MSDHMQKVQSGDPLKISAGTFNTFIDAATTHWADVLFACCRLVLRIGHADGFYLGRR